MIDREFRWAERWDAEDDALALGQRNRSRTRTLQQRTRDVVFSFNVVGLDSFEYGEWSEWEDVPVVNLE